MAGRSGMPAFGPVWALEKDSEKWLRLLLVALGTFELVPCTVRMGAGALDGDRDHGMHAIPTGECGHGGNCVTYRRKCSFTSIARRSDKGVCRLSPYTFCGRNAGVVDAAAAPEVVSRV